MENPKPRKDSGPESAPGGTPRTRPYARPLLVDYGSVALRTLNVGAMGNADGGSGATMKSQP